MKKIFKYTALALTALTLGSCNSFLDKMPDNRTTLDNEDKISDLLTTAYPTTSYLLVNELISDNCDYYDPTNHDGDRFGDETFQWKDVTETSNDCTDYLWTALYGDIAQANQALEAISELPDTTDSKVLQDKGEALLIRAYNHFILVNEFSQAYNPETSNKDLGIYYSKQVETYNSDAPRGTVAETYANIDKDIQEGLKLIGDDYTVPKYHFNKKAAYAFAARFYLFYDKWDEAVKYANLCLGSEPSLHDYDALEALPLSTSSQAITVAKTYCDAGANANLLIETANSFAGLAVGPWGYYTRYRHGNYIADNETFHAENIWGGKLLLRWKSFDNNTASSDFCVIMKVPAVFEEKDPVARTGYYHILNVTFSQDETLLVRAEAYTMLKQYDKACEDLNLWMHNFTKSTVQLTPESIQKFYKDIPYSYDDKDITKGSTIKKHLHPHFTIDAEGSVQESMLQCVLDFRRIETMHQGLRWWDIKRYNIVIPRRTMGSNGKPEKITDWLKQDDPRRAIQIPLTIRTAGVTPNPRN